MHDVNTYADNMAFSSSKQHSVAKKGKESEPLLVDMSCILSVSGADYQIVQEILPQILCHYSSVNV